MPVKLAISGRSPVSVSDDHISIGSDPCCSIVLSDAADVKPIHAVIKEISGRWLVESCDTDLLRVGGSEPGRRHWLKPGDVIELTQNGVKVTFQPADEDEDDDFMPLVPRFADASSKPASAPSQSVLKEDDIPLTDTVDLVLPTTSVSIPVTAPPPLSGTIPTTSAPLSGTIPTSKVTSPAAAQTKRPASGTIKAVKDPLEAKKSSQSDGEIPARRRKKSDGGGISADKAADDEIDLNLPVLTRTSSWEEEEFESVPRRRRSSEKAEMEWIMKVVGRCVAGGVAVLIVWIAASSLFKAVSQPSSGLPEASTGTDPGSATANTVVTTPSTQVPQRPPVKPVVTGQPATKIASAEEKSNDAIEKSVDAVESTEMEPAEMKDGDGSQTVAESSAESKPTETQDPAAEVSPTEQGPVSPVIQATVESLYAVVMQDKAGTEQIHLGTAWAISDRHLVTSGTIAARIKGYTATAVQPSIDWSIRISDVRIHAKYVSSTADIATAVRNQNDKLLAQALVVQLRHNLAVLDLDPAHQLEKRLPVIVKPLKTTTETVYSMVGFPVDQPMGNVGHLQECRSKRLSPTGAARLKEPVVNVKFSTQVIERNWSGSPVLNKDNEVIGIYAEIPATDKLPPKKDRQEQVVVWLGLLRDFAADVLKKTAAVDEDI